MSDSMAEGKPKKRIFISACEVSAENHCVNLINALKAPSAFDDQNSNAAAQYEIEFTGIGGQKMALAGCELMEDTVTRAAMLYNAFSQLSFYFKLIKRIKEYFRQNKPDLVIVCDSPAFNFHVAKAATAVGSKVLFYVAPQLWAWAPWRIHKMRWCCDKLACILPFEQNWFDSRGINATFVGNPLLDNIEDNIEINRKDYNDYSARSAKIALMPGSRDAEIKTLWPAMQKIANKLKLNHPDIQIKAVAANDEKLQMLKAKQINHFDCDYSVADVYEISKWADLTLVASGSATLQVAAAACPMIIMYQSSRILWHLFGKWLIRTRFLSLVNILAGRQIVPEFMPYFSSIKPIVTESIDLLHSKLRLVKLSGELVDLTKPLAGQNTSEKVARIALDMISDS